MSLEEAGCPLQGSRWEPRAGAPSVLPGLSMASRCPVHPSGASAGLGATCLMGCFLIRSLALGCSQQGSLRGQPEVPLLPNPQQHSLSFLLPPHLQPTTNQPSPQSSRGCFLILRDHQSQAATTLRKHCALHTCSSLPHHQGEPQSSLSPSSVLSLRLQSGPCSRLQGSSGQDGPPSPLSRPSWTPQQPPEPRTEGPCLGAALGAPLAMGHRPAAPRPGDSGRASTATWERSMP